MVSVVGILAGFIALVLFGLIFAKTMDIASDTDEAIVAIPIIVVGVAVSFLPVVAFIY